MHKPPFKHRVQPTRGTMDLRRSFLWFSLNSSSCRPKRSTFGVPDVGTRTCLPRNIRMDPVVGSICAMRVALALVKNMVACPRPSFWKLKLEIANLDSCCAAGIYYLQIQDRS